jgi:hypothetical protein
VGGATEVECVLEELSQGCPLPHDGQARPAYRPVHVYDQAGRPWPGSIIAWWASPDGTETCCLRLSGAWTPQWALFDSGRIGLLV